MSECRQRRLYQTKGKVETAGNAEILTLKVIKPGMDTREVIARIWDVPDLPLPVAPWVPELAEAVAQKRINTQRLSESVPDGEFLRLKRALERSASEDFYTRWAQWFFADRSQRTISPFSTVTVSQYVQHRIEVQRVRAEIMGQIRNLSNPVPP